MRIFASFIKNNQREIALIIGYALVALLFFNLGRYQAATEPPEISIEEPAIDLSNIQFNNIATPDSAQAGTVAGEQTGELDCAGKIKGNISSSSKIYHMPGGAFYNRTNPEMCFATEAEAQAAGFRRSQR